MGRDSTSPADRRKHKARSRQDRRRQFLSRGFCLTCCKRPLTSKTQCRQCLLERVSRKYFATATRWKELDDLLRKQQYKCYYTSQPIDIGHEASLEHILPASKYPSRKNDIRNLCWIHQTVNFMKRGMLIDEFIKQCRLVLMSFGYDVSKKDER